MVALITSCFQTDLGNPRTNAIADCRYLIDQNSVSGWLPGANPSSRRSENSMDNLRVLSRIQHNQ